MTDFVYAEGSDTINGAGGDDHIEFGGTVDGGDGDDLIINPWSSTQGGAGDDRVVDPVSGPVAGGAGFDSLEYAMTDLSIDDPVVIVLTNASGSFDLGQEWGSPR